MGDTYGKVAESRAAVVTLRSRCGKKGKNWTVAASALSGFSYRYVVAAMKRLPVSETVALKMFAGLVPFWTSAFQSARVGEALRSVQCAAHACSSAQPRSMYCWVGH